MRRATIDDPDDGAVAAAGGMEGGAPQTYPSIAAAAADRRRLRRAGLEGSEGVEEDGDGMARLLAEQRAFLSSQQAPAARLVRRDAAASAGAGAAGGLVGRM